MGGHSLLQGILSFLLISVNRGSRGRLKAGEERCPFCLPAIISFQYPPQPQSFAHHKPLVPASSTLWNQPHHTCKQQSVTSSTCPYSDGPASSLSSSLRSGSCFLQSLSVLASALSLCIQPSAHVLTKSLQSHVLWTAACQAPSSVRLSRQEHWSRLPCPPPGDLPHPGIEPASPVYFLGRPVLYHWHHLGRPFSPLAPCEASCFYKSFLLIHTTLGLPRWH